jgi:DNA-binding transcriptional LysR family regulator
MDLRQLEIFARVAELGSFSRAAEALHLTQPTVSEHIRALEDELGVRLLDRLGRATGPTGAGRLLLSYATRMLALAREARQALDSVQGRMRGELLVGGSTIPGEYILPGLLGRFREKFQGGDGHHHHVANRGGGGLPAGRARCPPCPRSRDHARVPPPHPPRAQPLAGGGGLPALHRGAARLIRVIGVPDACFPRASTRPI